jgi:hypothetical protein
MRLQTMPVGTLDQDSPQSDMSSTNPQFLFYIISLPLIVNDSDSCDSYSMPIRPEEVKPLAFH